MPAGLLCGQQCGGAAHAALPASPRDCGGGADLAFLQGSASAAAAAAAATAPSVSRGGGGPGCAEGGGFGGPSDGAPEPHQIPDRKSDDEFFADTEPNQALIYRLSGDRNPLHSDPEIAKAAGFDAPILHGLCTYGTACRTIISNVCNYDSTLIEEFNVRFSSPVYPGEKISTEIWKDDNVISFRCWVRDRNVMVLNNGKCVLKK